MELNEMSLAGKKRLTRWIGKQTRNHNHVCVSKLVASAPSEFKLFKMCRFIDKCYKERQEASESPQIPSEVLTEGTGSENTTESVCEGHETAIEENIDYRAKHKALLSDTQKKYDSFTNRTKGRILDTINKRMDVPISRIISDAEDETEVIRFLDEIESREVVVSKDVRLWTVRQVV